ncbi:MAG: GAF domain-containing protein [Cyclobacteriaceae bacterium]|nr:GAF domain-containing protein [Cyclobacteriaceae bacterium]
MAEDLMVSDSQDKEQKYKTLIPQLKSLIEGEVDLIANLGNISAALKETFDFLWVGFYLVKGDQLVLGPFQGPVACTRIEKGKGVCGTAWEQERTIIVEDVETFPGHIACSSLSKSEIVIPVMSDGRVTMVLDVDAEHYKQFNEVDSEYLNQIVDLLANNR